MTDLALINTSTDEVISRHRTGSWVDLPNGDRVSPAEAGWVHASAPYGLLAIVPVEVPPGKVATDRYVELIDGIAYERATLIDWTPPAWWPGGA